MSSYFPVISIKLYRPVMNRYGILDSRNNYWISNEDDGLPDGPVPFDTFVPGSDTEQEQSGTHKPRGNREDRDLGEVKVRTTLNSELDAAFIEHVRKIVQEQAALAASLVPPDPSGAGSSHDPMTGGAEAYDADTDGTE